MQGCEDPTQVDPLNQALGEYLRIPGMKAAILVSDQGLMISGIAQDHVDTASIAALVIDTVAAAQRFGLQLQAGLLDTMRIEFEDLTVVVGAVHGRRDACPRGGPRFSGRFTGRLCPRAGAGATPCRRNLLGAGSERTRAARPDLLPRHVIEEADNIRLRPSAPDFPDEPRRSDYREHLARPGDVRVGF